ncbi:oxidoreductase [Longimonas halophila]|uniref:Oxidoreductase n=1 Tax=Longimonas halophila TaxID=1469170 RepID=A0A2H3NPL4_9BACT|nr:PhzF family phenazine biosynthesis protein [Longimonas halophila]PEN09211.1 oxidoreductase [Longimonas halophila]
MTISFFLVDAFTNRPFEGNPAGVCILPEAAPARWMQSVAREVGASETAFVVAPQGKQARLRWFTPTDEVDLCGHATLAAAHALRMHEADTNAPERVSVIFETASGLLTAQYTDAGIRLDFPADAPSPADPPAGLIDACTIPVPVWSGRSARDWLLHVPTPQDVEAAAPDMDALSQFDTRGVILTAESPSESDHDFVSRFFAPQVGVPEDPVTGSAHCALGPYWRDRLGRSDLTGYQASSRGGTVRIHLPEPPASSEARVHLFGACCTMVQGTWQAPPNATSPDAEARQSPSL